MAISIRCPNCATSITVADKHTGRRVHCPICGHAMAITPPKKASPLETTPPRRVSEHHAEVDPPEAGGADPVSDAQAPRHADTLPLATGPPSQEPARGRADDMQVGVGDNVFVESRGRSEPKVPEAPGSRFAAEHEGDRVDGYDVKPVERPAPVTAPAPDTPPGAGSPPSPIGGPTDVTQCPSCKHSIAPGKTQCTMCGYDLTTGRQERLGEWWDQPTMLGWRIAAALVALPVLVTWIGGAGNTLYLIGVTVVPACLAVGLWRGSDIARNVWFLVLIIINAVSLLPSLLSAPPRMFEGLGWFVCLVLWFSGWFLLTARYATRRFVAIGFAIVLGGPVVGVLTYLLLLAFRALVSLVF